MFRQMIEARLNDLHYKIDEETGLKSVIAIHNTRRGPAMGGCRIIPYSSLDEATTDAIRLARGMGYKAALAGLDLGGGKAVIMEPQGPYDRQALFQAFGRFINELGGRYITAMDSGSTVADMDTIATQSKHVTCTSAYGSPAFYTATGVYQGIKACLNAHPELPDDIRGLRVAVQGLGNVGHALCQMLHSDGAQLIVADIDEQRTSQCVREFGAKPVPPDEIHSTPCELFSPCGLGGILTEESIGQLQCAVVAGSANNQLLTARAGQLLFNRNIFYAPDYLINAGGLIFVAMKHHGQSEKNIKHRIQGIHQTLLQIFQQQKLIGKPGSTIADQMAENILYLQNTEL